MVVQKVFEVHNFERDTHENECQMGENLKSFRKTQESMLNIEHDRVAVEVEFDLVDAAAVADDGDDGVDAPGERLPL